MKISALEGSDLEIELSKYLLLYHGTPHSSTNKTPAELMLHRQVCDKLPSISHPSPFFEDVRELDAIAKERGKVFADRKRRATNKNLAVGDLVLLPVPKSNKLLPSFNPNPFTIIETSPG